MNKTEAKKVFKMIRQKHYTKNEIIDILKNITIESVLTLPPTSYDNLAVPNTGTVEKIYFNLNLSNEEVLELLKQYNSPYFIYATETKLLYTFTPSDGIYMLIDKDDNVIYSSSVYKGFNVYFNGWNPEFSGVIELNETVLDTFEGYPVGLNNDGLSTLISTSEFKKIASSNKFYNCDGKLYYFNGTDYTQLGNGVSNGGSTITKVSELENDLNFISLDDYREAGALLGISGLIASEIIYTPEISNVETINGESIDKILRNPITDVEELPEVTLNYAKVQPNGIYGSGSKLYLNTDLTAQEVTNLLKNLTYDYVDGDNAYSILISNETHTKYVMAQRNQTSWYGIVSSDYGVVFSSSERPSIANFKGWKDGFDGIVLTDAGACFNTVTINGTTYNCGVNNEDIVLLFSRIPFEYITEFDTNILYRLDNKLYQFNGVKWVMLNEEPIEDVDELPSLNGTTIPNSGYVDTIYLNTQLGIDEVTAICKKVTLDSNYKYRVLVDNDRSHHLRIYNNSEGADDTFEITDASGNNFYWTNSDDAANYYWQGKAGWNPNLSNVIEIKNDVLSSYSGSVGTENDKITELFSLTPFKVVNESVFYRIGTKLYHTKGGTFYEIGGYSKEEIDTMIGDINSILDTLNGEVV